MFKFAPQSKFDYRRSARFKRWIFVLMPSEISVFIFRKIVDRNLERNSIEAAKFQYEAVTVYPTKGYFLIPKCLKFAFALGCPDLPLSYQRFLSRAVIECRKSPSSRYKISNDVNIRTRELGYTNLSPHSWKLLALTLAGFGFIIAGSIARELCMKSAIIRSKSNTRTARTLSLAIRANLERRNFDEAVQLMSQVDTTDKTEIEFKSYWQYLILMSNIQSPKIKVTDTPKTAGDKIFEHLIFDKTIALVAPGQITSEYGDEIDSKDTVVRIKFYGRSSIHPPSFGGSRCDITSHNSDFLEISQDNRHIQDLICDAPDLKLLVSKRKITKEESPLPIKIMNSWAPTFLTTATSGTLMLFEIIKAKPRKVFLYGFDFYTNRLGYNSQLLNSYRIGSAPGLHSNELMWNGKSLASASLARNHISHNLLSDFILIKNLYELSGLIIGSREVIDILELSPQKYDEILESTLGEW